MKNTQTNKKINLAQINFDFVNAKRVTKRTEFVLFVRKRLIYSERKRNIFFAESLVNLRI